MRKNYSKIVCLLDRSGSMDSIKEATIAGFNTFLKEQQKLDGKCDISLYQFDDKYETVYKNYDISSTPKLTDKTFVPRGNTALLDAIGRTINSLGEDLRDMEERERPEKVLFVVITDGQENSSKEFTRDKIFNMITHQKEKYNWFFVFLAANQDAIATATSYGINAGSAFTYAATSKGTTGAYNAMNWALSGARCASLDTLQSINFADYQNS